MTAEGIEPIFRTSNRLIRETDCSFHRYLAKEIDWNEPLVCIMGARGAGKTTLILQHKPKNGSRGRIFSHSFIAVTRTICCFTL